MRATLVFLIMIVLIPLALFRPYYGLLGYYWMGFMRPMELAWYIRVFDYGLVLGVAVVLGYFLYGMRENPMQLAPCWHLILLWAVLLMACLHAYVPGAAYNKFWEFTKIIIMCVVTASLISTDQKRLRELMLVIAFSAGMLGLHGLKQAIFTGGGTVKGPGGYIGENNDFALYLNMMIPVIYYVGKTVQKRRWRHLFYFMAIASAISVVFCYSRGGYLGLAALILVFSVKADKKAIGILGLIFTLFAFLLFAPQRVMERLLSIKEAHKTDASAMSRLEAWKTAIKMMQTHPILGVGPRNFTLVYNAFNPGSIPWDTHSGYLRMGAEAGLPALFIFLFLIFGTLWKLRRERKFLKRASGPPDLIAYCHGIEAGIIGYSIGNLFGSRHDLDTFYYLLAAAVCIHMQVKAWAEAHAPTEARKRFEMITERLGASRVGVR